MPIFVVGMNHKTASATLREQFYFDTKKLPLYFQDLLNKDIVREIVILSTCNRSEVYAEADDGHLIKEWFFAQARSTYDSFHHAVYMYQQEKAVSHIMQVSCGLDSMVLGEPQIAGQMKTAFSEAAALGGIGTIFHRLFKQVFSITKEIRNTTVLGACPASLASAAIQQVKQHLGCTPEDIKTALIGSGSTTQLLLRHLKGYVKTPLAIVSRNIDTANQLINMWDWQGTVYGLDEILFALKEVDIVFSATGSMIPLLTQSMIQEIMLARLSRPLLLIDLAIPRDIEPHVTDISNVTLYNIDDLKTVIKNHDQNYEHAACKAHEMIQEKSATFIHELQFTELTTEAICAYRKQAETACRIALDKAKQQLEQGIAPEVVLEQFARILTNKLLHIPSTQLRQAGLEGQRDVLQLAKRLFAMSES